MGDGASKNVDNVSKKGEKLPPYSRLRDVGYFRVTDREFVDYQLYFRINSNYFKPNSKIVDIGSGTNQEFARLMHTHRPDVTVYSVDPSLTIQLDPAKDQERGIRYEVADGRGRFYSPGAEERLERRRNAEKFTIPAIAPNLPFPDDSVDYIFDNHGALLYFPVDNGLIKTYFRQLYRITKPGGEIQIFPIDSMDERSLSEDELCQVSNKRISTILSELATELKMSFELFETYDIGSRTETLRCGVKINKLIAPQT